MCVYVLGREKKSEREGAGNWLASGDRASGERQWGGEGWTRREGRQ